jgi:membrane protease YdiL (CAAX protease family)
MSEEELRFIIAVSWCAIGFAAYYFLSQGKQVLIQRMLGLLILGGGSVLLIILLPGATLKNYGLGFAFQAAPPWWAFLAVPLILVLGYFAAGKSENLKLYPQIRSPEWSPQLVALSAASWVVFLIAYEALFRGLLLHASLEVMATAPAIALNCALYAFAHFYKGPGETFGAIFVGVLFCYLTFVTGNFWCALILHSVMALSNEWFSLRAHPDMKIVKTG